MIRLIECKNYRCLKYVAQELDNFQVLIGPNASGKTTFLDVVGFISDIVSDGIDKAITQKRSTNFSDLTFGGNGDPIELAIEAVLPEKIYRKLGDPSFDTIRYEVRIGLNPKTLEHEINEERVLLLKYQEKLKKIHEPVQKTLFPETIPVPDTILNKSYPRGTSRLVIRKRPEGNDNFYNETTKEYNKGGGWLPSFKLGIKKSALGNLPADETKFPASTWLKDYLLEGIQLFILNSVNIRQASPPGQSQKFKTDGSNLPWVIEGLKKHPVRFDGWIKHIRTALPDIETIDTVEREDDRHRYLRIRYTKSYYCSKLVGIGWYASASSTNDSCLFA